MVKKIYEMLLGSKAKALVTGVLLFAAVSAADYYLRNEISIDIFYFLPIFVLTWRGSRGWGLAAAAAGVLVWLTDERVFMPGFQDQFSLVLWNAVVRLSFFSVLVLLLHELRVIIHRERAVSRLKSAMIHTVSHEFNNSLTGLSAGLFLLKEMDPAAAEAAKGRIYSSMESALSNLTLYVKNILNEARMEEGRFTIEKRPVALRELASEAAAPMQELLEQKGIELEMSMPQVPAMVSADREALALVVSNLIGNAVKYTRKDGAITVSIEASGGKVIFSVEDSGIGISLEDMKKITSGFYRTEEGQMQAAGFGMGLKITNDLLALHGSRLEISSEKGRGSRFFFELPVLETGGQAARGNI
ncbi:MAG: HAMP domain-containing histidine kinase [Elusimicrobia bacterium]|nr:HAMP domain-containing histidine kinase [Elusimicrobiota bacterium]